MNIEKVNEAHALALIARQAVDNARAAAAAVDPRATRQLFEAFGLLHEACCKLEWLRDSPGTYPSDAPP